MILFIIYIEYYWMKILHVLDDHHHFAAVSLSCSETKVSDTKT
jgi:hypothetical protein